MWQHFYSSRERSHAKVSAINQQRYLLQLSQQTLSSLTNFSLSWGTNNCLGICWNYELMSYDGPASVMFIGEIFFSRKSNNQRLSGSSGFCKSSSPILEAKHQERQAQFKYYQTRRKICVLLSYKLIDKLVLIK